MSFGVTILGMLAVGRRVGRLAVKAFESSVVAKENLRVIGFGNKLEMHKRHRSLSLLPS